MSCTSIGHSASFLCVILERSEESRTLFFDFSLCHSEPLRRKIPEALARRRAGTLRSADSTQNDTKNRRTARDRRFFSDAVVSVQYPVRCSPPKRSIQLSRSDLRH